MAMRHILTSILAAILAALPRVLAHGEVHGTHTIADMVHSHSDAHNATPIQTTTDAVGLASYFSSTEYPGWLLAHIVLMVISWTILLPIAAFISSARSKLAIPVQGLFMILNAVGILASIVHNLNTPDLYPNNAHHKIGWAVTWIAMAWVALSLLERPNRRVKPGPASLDEATHRMTHSSMAEHDHWHGHKTGRPSSWSYDSGHGTEPSSPGSSRAMSSDMVPHKLEDARPLLKDDDDDDEHDPSGLDDSSANSLTYLLIHLTRQLRSGPLSITIRILNVVLERAQLLLAFLALATGVITRSGIFRGPNLLNGLAHWIKGGIFFWYGLLTLGRWMGAFADWGWAWNLRPGFPEVSRLAARVPTAEFVESFVICVYGASNVFLEHLGADPANPTWSAADVEHVSITVMFFGGGLLGMLLDSRLAAPLSTSSDDPPGSRATSSPCAQRGPAASLNPLPALVIFLLGLMMSSHHQASMVSARVHKQWGMLFAGFSASRIATYILLFLQPPCSQLPSRPPTELLASFCLVCGGLVFMVSTRDVVEAIERNGLHAGAVLTVTVGVSCLVMAWGMVLYAIRGWALRREQARRA